MIDYTYKDLFLQDSVDKQLKIEVEDGTVITNEDIWSESMSIDESLCSEGSLTFGCCESSQFKIKISNHFSPLINLWITVTVTLDGHTDEPFLIGRYKVQSDKPTADRTYREIIAYDSMYDIINADKELVADWYEELLPDDSSSVTMREFRDSFIALFGLEVIATNLCNDTMTVEKTVSGTELSGEYILESICEINGCFGHITRDGKFQFVTIGEIVDGEITYVLAADDESYLGNLEYGYTDTAILGRAVTGYAVLGNSDDPEREDDINTAIEVYSDNYGQKTNEIAQTYEISCTYEDFETQRINKVQVREEDRDIGAIVGTGDNCYVIENNLFTYGKDLNDLEKIAEAIYDEISVITYRPATIDAKGNPCYEVGDAIKLVTKYETIYTLILNRSLTGIQSLMDEYVADGVETYADNSVGLNAQVEQLKGQTNTLIRSVDENTFQISNIHGDLSEIQMTIDSISFTVSSQGTQAQYDYLDCQNFEKGELPEGWEENHSVYGTFEYFTGNNSSSSGLPEGWETYTQSEYNTGTALATNDAWLGSYCRVEKTDSERGQFGIHRRVPITGTWNDKDLSGTLSVKCKIAKPDDSPDDMIVVLGFTKGGMGYYSSFECYSSGWLEIEYTRSSTTLASGEYIYIDICTATEGAFYVTDIEATLDGETLVSEDFSGNGKYDLGSCAKITKTTEGSSINIYPALIYDLGELSSGDYRIRFKAMTDAGYTASASVRYGVYPGENEEDGIFNIATNLKSTEWTTIEEVVSVDYWSGSVYFSIGAYETDAPIYITDIEFLYPAASSSATGLLGGTASIVMTVGDNEVAEELNLENVRESFAEDNSQITISAGRVTFSSGTLVIISNGLTLDSNGNATFSGELIAASGSFSGEIAASSGTIGGWEIGDSSLYNGCDSLESMQNGVFLGTNGIRLYNDYNYINIDGNIIENGTCYNDGEDRSVFLTDGHLTFYYEGQKIGHITAQYFNYNGVAYKDERGIEINAEYGSKYISLNGAQSENTEEAEYIRYYEINLGASHPVYTERHIFYGTARFTGSITRTSALNIYENNEYTEEISVTIEGDVYNTGEYYTASDEDIKTDIKNLDDNIDPDSLIDRLKPVTYKLKADESEKTHIGLTYQNLKDDIEKAGINPDEMGVLSEIDNINGKTVGAIAYDELIPVLIDEIQKLKKQVDNLKTA